MMPRAWRLALVGCVLLAGLVGGSRCADARRSGRAAEAGVWFESIHFRSAELDGALTAQDLAIVESAARAEIARAFAGLRIRVTDRRDAPYRVRIVESVRDPRFRSHVEVAGASWGTSGARGHGVVSFTLLASGALANVPAGADRVTKLETIGRGVARSVVHELAHQFFPSDPIHSDDVESFEYPSAARPAHYRGAMRWSRAWPLLQARFGTARDASGPGQ